MDKIRRISSAVCLAVMVTSCVSAQNGSRPDGTEVERITLPVRTPHWLNDQELSGFKQLALIGDLPASYCLAKHYGVEGNPNDPERTYWILIAAENGDASAMTIISEIFRTGRDKRARERAEFWRLRAESTRSQANINCHGAVR